MDVYGVNQDLQGSWDNLSALYPLLIYPACLGFAWWWSTAVDCLSGRPWQQAVNLFKVPGKHRAEFSLHRMENRMRRRDCKSGGLLLTLVVAVLVFESIAFAQSSQIPSRAYERSCADKLCGNCPSSPYQCGVEYH